MSAEVGTQGRCRKMTLRGSANCALHNWRKTAAQNWEPTLSARANRKANYGTAIRRDSGGPTSARLRELVLRGESTRNPPTLAGATSPLSRRGAARTIRRSQWLSEAPLPGRRRGEMPALLAAMPSRQPRGDCAVPRPPSQSPTTAKICSLNSASRTCWASASSPCHCARPQRRTRSRGKSTAGRSVATRFSGSLARSPATCAGGDGGGQRRNGRGGENWRWPGGRANEHSLQIGSPSLSSQKNPTIDGERAPRSASIALVDSTPAFGYRTYKQSCPLIPIGTPRPLPTSSRRSPGRATCQSPSRSTRPPPSPGRRGRGSPWWTGPGSRRPPGRGARRRRRQTSLATARRQKRGVSSVYYNRV